MKNPFNRETDDSPPALQGVREARELVPSSAKSPDAQRRTLFDPDEEIDESADEDLAFLHSLIDGDATPVAPTTPRTPPEPRHEPDIARRGDDLDVFREMAALRQRVELTKHLRVDDVDMGDLLEELQTTRAALRHLRKAA
jgi:hypothetical protein